MKFLILLLIFVVLSSCAAIRDNRAKIVVMRKALKKAQSDVESPEEIKKVFKNIDINCIITETDLTDPGDITERKIENYDVSEELLKITIEKLIAFSHVCPVDSKMAGALYFDTFMAPLKSNDERKNSDEALCFQFQLTKMNVTSSMLDGFDRKAMIMTDEECDELTEFTNLKADTLKLYPTDLKYKLMILILGRPSDEAIVTLKKEYIDFYDEEIAKHSKSGSGRNAIGVILLISSIVLSKLI